MGHVILIQNVCMWKNVWNLAGYKRAKNVLYDEIFWQNLIAGAVEKEFPRFHRKT